MPIYEYKCQNCGHSFEQLQKTTDKLLSTCPECGKKQLKKLVSNTSFQLKGTGWYVTDFKDKKETTSSKPRDKPKADEKHKSTKDKNDKSPVQ
ncbi:MAG: zinc ribbon domain-containing protein [bacterium]